MNVLFFVGCFKNRFDVASKDWYKDAKGGKKVYLEVEGGKGPNTVMSSEVFGNMTFKGKPVDLDTSYVIKAIEREEKEGDKYVRYKLEIKQEVTNFNSIISDYGTPTTFDTLINEKPVDQAVLTAEKHSDFLNAK